MLLLSQPRIKLRNFLNLTKYYRLLKSRNLKIKLLFTRCPGLIFLPFCPYKKLHSCMEFSDNNTVSLRDYFNFTTITSSNHATLHFNHATLYEVSSIQIFSTVQSSENGNWWLILLLSCLAESHKRNGLTIAWKARLKYIVFLGQTKFIDNNRLRYHTALTLGKPTTQGWHPCETNALAI